MKNSCSECGSQLTMSSGPKRYRWYRGDEGYEIPEDMSLETCEGCGAVWMTSEQIDRLSEVFELERVRRARGS